MLYFSPGNSIPRVCFCVINYTQGQRKNVNWGGGENSIFTIQVKNAFLSFPALSEAPPAHLSAVILSFPHGRNAESPPAMSPAPGCHPKLSGRIAECCPTADTETALTLRQHLGTRVWFITAASALGFNKSITDRERYLAYK